MERISEVLSNLPGLSGYKQRETRREVDKRIRQSLMEALEEVRSALSDLQLDVLNVGGLRWMDDMERINSRLTLLVDKVRSAAYGYRPLFDLEQVREAELDRLIQFDRTLLQQVETLKRHLATAREAASGSADAFGKALREFYTSLGELLELYNRRDELIRTGAARRPAPESSTDSDTSLQTD